MTRLLLALLLATPAGALPLDRLPALVGDRVAAAATDCIDRLDIDQVHLVAGAIVFTMKARGTVYYNLPVAGGGFIHDGIVPVIDGAYPRLCRDAPVRLLNENSHAPVATARLGPFIPYRRP